MLQIQKYISVITELHVWFVVANNNHPYTVYTDDIIFFGVGNWQLQPTYIRTLVVCKFFPHVYESKLVFVYARCIVVWHNTYAALCRIRTIVIGYITQRCTLYQLVPLASSFDKTRSCFVVVAPRSTIKNGVLRGIVAVLILIRFLLYSYCRALTLSIEIVIHYVIFVT